MTGGVEDVYGPSPPLLLVVVSTIVMESFSFSTSKVRNDGVSHSNSKEEERTATTTKEIWDGGNNPQCQGSSFFFSFQVRDDRGSHSNSKERGKDNGNNPGNRDGGSNPQCQGSSFFFSFQVRDDRGSHSNSKEEERTTATTQEIGMVAAAPNAKEVLSSYPSKLAKMVLTKLRKMRVAWK
ncbi:hypothetical protein OIU78_024991 [Salix suchowensis]|nr:hypothetical protein OIU78_024991 [Salix suchowensis]